LAKKDLVIWKNFLQDKEGCWPIAEEDLEPPASSIVFISDATGCAGHLKSGDQLGAASLGFDFDGCIFFSKKLPWPTDMMLKAKDSQGESFVSKSLTLELLGLLFLLVSIPEKLKDKFVIMKVDNISCVFGWENGYAKNDVCARIIIRAIMLVTSFLGIHLTVKHRPRVSNWEAEKVDRMSRKSTTTIEDSKLLAQFVFRDWPESLKIWLQNPTEDWDLPLNILQDVKKMCD
jgi:hypothetical protein